MIEEMTQVRSLEIENPDTEIQDVCEEIGGTLEAAFDLLIERRDRQYAAAIAPLDAEREALEQESASIEEAAHNLELLLPAKARIAQNEADQLTVAGKSEEAKAKLEEMRQAESAPGAMRARQREIANRIEAIEAEKQTAARRIFASWHEDCQAIIRPIEHGLFVVLLDGLQKSFYDFQTRTNTAGDGVLNTLFKLGHITDLTAGERSPEWASGNRWYGGRR
jgi:hypothetical protein